jgi:RecA/RadA recombinase
MNYFDDLVAPVAKINEYTNTYADVESYVDTGSYLLNALMSGSIYGGLPGNKITIFAGESSTGKTFFSLGIIDQFLKDNLDGGVILFESEHAITKQMLADRGVDLKRLIIVPVTTIQEFRHQALLILDRYKGQDPKLRAPMMLGLDSLGMLSTTKEVSDTAEGKETKDMTRPGIIKAAFRVLTLKLGQLGVPMLVTNHVYAAMTSMYPSNTMGGGSGPMYSSDNIVTLSRRKEKDGKEVVGHVIHCKNTKSRLTKENAMIDVLLRYDTGLHRYYGLIDIAVELGIWKKISTRIELEDGRKLYEKAILKDADNIFTKEILDKIDEYCQKEYTYGLGQEALEEVIDE